MFRRVLVANRGEIALRVLRALHDLGVEGVSVFSDADASAPHVRAATQAIRLGPAEPAASYLHVRRILDAARRAKAQAIHPGYGFLAENAAFAEAVEAAGLVWIGPPPAAMRAVGDKVSARALAQREGVPTAPGSPGAVADAAEAARIAQDVGYPVLLKASAGGGGIGMKVVGRPEELSAEFEAARSTAQAAFGDGTLLLEKFIERPRHIEVQVLGDAAGHLVHLGERECSVQRRHQKILEECPSPALTPQERSHVGDLALKLMRAAGYRNAGTAEFLYKDGQFYFNEVNARLQVEHPVTEAVYGVDLVQAQVQVAAGEPLPFDQGQLQPHGHAIEVRVNAEDALHDFLPSPGPLRRWRIPMGPGIRVDAGFEEGSRVPPQYDSLLAKVIAHAPTREEARARLEQCLAHTEIEGVASNLRLHQLILADESFRRGDLSTSYLADRRLVDALRADHASRRRAAMTIAAGLAAAPRGGLGLHYARQHRPPQLGGSHP